MKIARGGRADFLHILFAQRPKNFVQDSQCLLPRLPFRLGPEQIFLCHHFQNWAHVLGHAAVNQNQALLQFPAHLCRRFAFIEDMMNRHQSPAAQPKLRIAFAGRGALD